MSITYLEFHKNLMDSLENSRNLYSVNRPELQGSMQQTYQPIRRISAIATMNIC